MDFKQWNGFNKGSWTNSVDVRQFIQKNYTPYTGDDSFLADATEKTNALWNVVLDLYKKEKDNGGVLDIDTKTISTITSHKPGYIQKDLEDAREEYEVPKDADADERAKINKKRARALSSINEKAKNDLSTINNKYNTQSENVRKNTANQRQALRENKKTEMASNSETAKKERAEVASNLKATITMAKEQYQSRKEEIINKYEGIYDNEYDNIKSEYYKQA